MCGRSSIQRQKIFFLKPIVTLIQGVSYVCNLSRLDMGVR